MAVKKKAKKAEVTKRVKSQVKLDPRMVNDIRRDFWIHKASAA